VLFNIAQDNSEQQDQLNTALEGKELILTFHMKKDTKDTKRRERSHYCVAQYLPGIHCRTPTADTCTVAHLGQEDNPGERKILAAIPALFDKLVGKAEVEGRQQDKQRLSQAAARVRDVLSTIAFSSMLPFALASNFL